MSPGGAYEDEVHSLRHISDEDADRLLCGDLPAGDSSLDELAAFVQDVGVAYSTPPTEPVQARQLDAMRRAARPRADGWNPFAEPAETGSAPGRDGPGLPERVRRRLAAFAPRPRLAGAAAALAVCLAFSTLTALGQLPEPVQAAVSDAARAVGVSVPNPRAERSKGKPHHRKQKGGVPAVRAAHIVAPPTRPAGGQPAAAPRRTEPKTGSCGATACASDGMDQLPTITTPDPPSLGVPSDPPSEAPSESGPDTGPEPQPGTNGDQSGAPSQSPLPVP